MPDTWSELTADRWSWIERSLSWLEHAATRITGSSSPIRFTTVMVIGDSQAGKTTLLTHLLGVTDPAAHRQAEYVLRAERPPGSSATSTPILYSWSDDPTLWMLRDPATNELAWLDDEAMRGKLAQYRSGGAGTPCRAPDQPPLHIGIPRHLAGPNRQRELRVLDTPGLFAADAAEQDAAMAIIARFSMFMSVKIVVQPANHLTGFDAEVFRESPQLRGWTDPGSGFRIVLTYGFSDAAVSEELASMPGALTAERAADFACTRHAHELADAVYGAADPAELASRLYPIDVGATRTSLADYPDIGETLSAANESMIDRLRRSLLSATGDEPYLRSAPQIAGRIREIVEYRRRARARELDRARSALTEATREFETASRLRESKTAERDAAETRLAEYRKAVSGLTEMTLAPDLPNRPGTGREARRQRRAQPELWYAAARDLWRSWLGTLENEDIRHRFGDSPPVTESRLRARYSEIAPCCGECSSSRFARFFGDADDPLECHRRMVRAIEPVHEWIMGEFEHATEAGATALTAELRRIRIAEAAATRQELRSHAALEHSRIAVADLESASFAARLQDERDGQVADRYLDVLHGNYRARIRELMDALSAAPPPARAFYAVAILRTCLDRQIMLGTTMSDDFSPVTRDPAFDDVIAAIVAGPVENALTEVDRRIAGLAADVIAERHAIEETRTRVAAATDVLTAISDRLSGVVADAERRNRMLLVQFVLLLANTAGLLVLLVVVLVR